MELGGSGGSWKELVEVRRNGRELEGIGRSWEVLERVERSRRDLVGPAVHTDLKMHPYAVVIARNSKSTSVST